MAPFTTRSQVKSVKLFSKAFLIAALIAAPVVSVAQSNEPSPAQVRAGIGATRKAGYDPHD